MARILAAASGGGHLDQLVILTSDITAHDIRYATTDMDQAAKHGLSDARLLPDCNLHEPFRALGCAVASLRIVARDRPEIVVSTGAAPGFFCLLWGKLFGARTLWIDSVANAEQLSLSGRMARRTAHRCLTQWEHLADGKSVRFAGSVL